MLKSNILPICMFAFANLFYYSSATLKTQFVEDLCFSSNSATINTKYEKSGILMSTPIFRNEEFSCEVTILADMQATLVLSIYKYDLAKDDELTIEDSDHHKIALIGRSIFKDERKSIMSNNKVVIHYKKSNSSIYRSGFQFTYTELQNPPCLSNEFKCKNGKCISMTLACDGHNHCGDRSDEIKCRPDESGNSNLFVNVSGKRSNITVVWISTIIVAAIILAIVIIVFVVVLVRRAKLKKSMSEQPENQPNGNIPLQSVSSTVLPARATTANEIQGVAANEPVPTFFNRMRQSFRRQPAHHMDEIPVAQEVISVPSMYPNLEQVPPTAPDLSGAENPSFKSDE